MSKFIYIFLLLVFTSCANVQEMISDALPVVAPNIPIELQEQIVSKVNPENEIFSVGKASINSTGTLLAQAKATQNAKILLKQKLKDEIKVQFNSFLLETDIYSREIIKPVLPELISYTVDLALKNINQKGQWQGETAVYSLVAIERNEVSKLSKKVFSGYLSDVSGKLNNIRTKIIEG